MRHLAARQLESSKRWDYTQELDHKVAPVGYCAKARIETESTGGKHIGHHETAAEAQDCYRRYLLAELLKLDGMHERLQQCEYQGCEVCTRSHARVGGFWVRTLCDAHRTIEVVGELFPAVVESFES